ncbi:TorF family putative porin [Pseudomonas sp. HK3]|jgi:uncharacterized protein (TIGR02001 family)
MKTLSKAVAIASLISAGVMASQAANAEVSYSAGVATTYLWRGQDLGGAAVSAAADYSHDSGAYAGVWGSSGDLALGNEYDLYVGFAKEFGDFSADLQAVTYVYNKATEDGNDVYGSPGELSDGILSLGFMDASVTYITSLISGSPSYVNLGYSVAGADIAVGISDNDGGQEYTHLDLSYGLTDQLSITVSKIVDQSNTTASLLGDDGIAGTDDDGSELDDDVIVVMSYSLPL